MNSRPSLRTRVQQAQRLLDSPLSALILYALAAVILAALLDRAMAPGGMTTDSFHQLDQALGTVPYDDWHPVIMSAGWSLLISLTGAVSSLAAVQIGFAAVCAWLTCWYLRDRSGSFRIGLLGLTLLIAPHTANLLGVIWKDTQMGLSYYAGAVLLLFASRHRRHTWIWGLAAIPFFAYGTLVRKNAVAALIPLLVWLAVLLFSDARVRGWIRRRVPRAIASLAAVFGLFAALLLGGGAAVDAALKPAHNAQFTQVMLDDLLFAVPQSAIDDSDAPQHLKDRIRSSRQLCQERKAIWDAYWKCWGRGAHGAFTEIADKDEVIALWKETLPSHLPRYADYRTETFAQFLFTSRLQFSPTTDVAAERGLDWDSPRMHRALELYVTEVGVAQLPWLFHGWFWLAGSSIGMLALARRWHRHVPELALFASAWIYIMSYLPAVPSQDYRYIYWSALAGTLAVLVLIARSFPRIRRRLRARPGPGSSEAATPGS